jgi:hypothetical protein
LAAPGESATIEAAVHLPFTTETNKISAIEKDRAAVMKRISLAPVNPGRFP